MNSPIIPEYKIAWIIPVLLLPIFGVILYLLIGRKSFKNKNKKFYFSSVKLRMGKSKQDLELVNLLMIEDKFVANLATYVYNQSLYPLTYGDIVEYFAQGEDYYAALKQSLASSTKFIFLEYFIIADGKVFEEVFEILKDKIKQGVEVRLIYDDYGSSLNFKDKNYKMLVASGIKVIKFNPLKPIIDIGMNHRTHRKIAVIDGQIAYTGGINLADEYINHIPRFGHWKDSGISLNGMGANSYTLMFIQMWNLQSEDKINNIEDYLVATKNTSTAYSVSFTDTPLDNEALTENVYIKMINNAKDYIYINTPYLIINSMMINALTRAAKSGVDVRIMLPGIPDKKMVFNLSKDYGTRLLKSKVKVYTYNQGFMHAKSLVSDDNYSLVGTANFDYRSLYLHFECASFIKDNITALKLKHDFLDLVEKSATPLVDIKHGLLHRAFYSIFRIIAPLL
jgi:cardiolipin synthase